MSRRASRPQFEAIEDRVLTTVAGSHIGLLQVERSSAEPQYQIWAQYNFLNTTNQNIRYRITIELADGTSFIQNKRIPAKTSSHSIPSVPARLVPGAPPHYFVTYQASPDRSITVPITPPLYNHEPTNAELRSNPFPDSYEFQNDIMGHLVLHRVQIYVMLRFANFTAHEIELEFGYHSPHHPHGRGILSDPVKIPADYDGIVRLPIIRLYDVVPIFTATYNASPHHPVTEVVHPIFLNHAPTSEDYKSIAYDYKLRRGADGRIKLVGPPKEAVYEPMGNPLFGTYF